MYTGPPTLLEDLMLHYHTGGGGRSRENPRKVWWDGWVAQVHISEFSDFCAHFIDFLYDFYSFLVFSKSVILLEKEHKSDFLSTLLLRYEATKSAPTRSFSCIFCIGTKKSSSKSSKFLSFKIGLKLWPVTRLEINF